MDESDHLTLVNVGDDQVVSQEEGGSEGSAAGEKKEGVGERYRYRTHAGTQGAREQY